MKPENHGSTEPCMPKIPVCCCLMHWPRPDTTGQHSCGQSWSDTLPSAYVTRPEPRRNVLLDLAYEQLQQSLIALGQTPEKHQKLREHIRLLLLTLSIRRRAEQSQGESCRG